MQGEMSSGRVGKSLHSVSCVLQFKGIVEKILGLYKEKPRSFDIRYRRLGRAACSTGSTREDGATQGDFHLPRRGETGSRRCREPVTACGHLISSGREKVPFDAGAA